jgi:hypothetical protein
MDNNRFDRSPAAGRVSRGDQVAAAVGLARMASCSRCNAPNADLFSPTGDLLCRSCFNVAQNTQAEQRARESLERDAPPGFKVTGPGAPPTSSRAMIAGGFAVMGFGCSSRWAP